MLSGVYGDDFIGITPAKELEPRTWCAPSGTRRPASETKQGRHVNVNPAKGSCC